MGDALSRCRLTVAYDGSAFHGFAPNDGVETVGGTLRDAIERILGRSISLTCAGRTDAGVHAWGQVVSFDAPVDADLADLAHRVNKLCDGRIVIRDATSAPSDFDARWSAHSRIYRYSVLNRPEPDPFLRATAFHVAQPLDLSTMRLACDPLIGEHDFASFCRVPKVPEGQPAASLVRCVVDARWEALDDGLLRFTIEANAFCHQMVRSIVGLMVDIGLGRRRAGEVAGILRARDRHGAANLAPPQGLCLWQVRY